eukprot:INCI13887.2.p1 GENE.INCI13887.2~~INCI13887.2.p1  ORF type:complete len:326 (+),score=50.11 INCI13887.2:376-1353(+)
MVSCCLHSYAKDALTGRRLWNRTNTTLGSATSPFFSNGIVYFGTESELDGGVELVALHSKTGATKWATGLPSGLLNDAPVVGKNGKVYVLLAPEASTATPTLHALDAETGRHIWSNKVEGTPSRPAVADDRVFVSAGATYAQGNWESTDLVVFNATTGEHLWTAAGKANQWATPTVVEKMVYTSAEETDFYALNVHNGKQEWHATVDGYNGLAPAYENGLVFLAGAMSSIYAFNATTGEQHWSNLLNPDGHLWSVPTAAHGSVYVGGDDGKLHKLEASTGKVLWQFTAEEGMAVGSPVVGNGLVFVGANTPWGTGSPDQLYAVEA